MPGAAQVASRDAMGLQVKRVGENRYSRARDRTSHTHRKQIDEGRKGVLSHFTWVEIREVVADETELVGELDLCWIIDGRFGIAEVKTSAKDFTAQECTKLVKLARRVGPDEVLIAAVDGPDSIVEHAKSMIEQELDGVALRCFLPSSFGA
jgi:hypothetical protein